MNSVCSNILTVSGDKETIEAIEQACDDRRLLEFLCPYGDRGVLGEAFNVECNKPELEDGDWWLHITFDTNNTPPIKAYEAAIIRLGVGLSASYHNASHIFVGVYDLDGNISNMVDRRFDVDYDDQWWFADIPSDLVWEFDLWGEYEYYKECKQEELIR